MPHRACLWERGEMWGLTGKLLKGFYLGDKNILYFNRWGHSGMCYCHNSSNFKLMMYTLQNI